MKSRILTWFAIVLILETGLIHIIMAQAEYEHAAYMGYLFAANFFGALVSASGIYHKQFWGWSLGFVISAGSIVTYVWSRTLGLPSMEMEIGEWFTPYAVVSNLVESVFVLLFLLRPWKTPTAEFLPSATSNRRYILPAAGLFLLVTVSASAYQWNSMFTRALGQHVGSLAQVCRTPVTSFAALEERYGVQVSLVAISMLDSIVDVRLKVIDPEKASILLRHQAALLVNQEVLVLAPHQHHHGSIQRDKIHFLFFPTMNNTIQSGSQVSLVFGSIRVEPVLLR